MMALSLRFLRFLYGIFLAVFMIACHGGKRTAEDVLYTDSLFSAFSEEYGMNEAFKRFAHPDIVLLRQKQFPVSGKQKLSEFLKQNPDTCCTLIWKPEHAMVASSNDLGYTWGRYWIVSRSFHADTLRKGYYVTIWQKMRDGSWKVILDSGVEGNEAGQTGK